jgi:hypothetical protein
MILFIFTQITPSEIETAKDIIQSRNYTVEGVLFGGLLAMSYATRYLFKLNQRNQEKYIAELKETNKILIDLSNSYRESNIQLQAFARELTELRHSMNNNKIQKK